MKEVNTYAAFLRGINVGGNNPIKMEALRGAFEELGFKDVKTVLASGNVIFSTVSSDNRTLAGKIEKQLKDVFGKEIGVIVRSIDDIRSLVNAEPFKAIKAGPQIKFNVTFLPESLKTKPKLPDDLKNKGVQFTFSTKNEICISIDFSKKFKTPDLMAVLDKMFGRKVTTRTWNTIAKILKAADR